MKTTIDLPDDLFIEAKATAARRRTTLKDLITRSLRREIGSGPSLESPLDPHFRSGPLGLPVLKSAGPRMSADEYSRLIAQLEAEEDEKHLQHLRP